MNAPTPRGGGTLLHLIRELARAEPLRPALREGALEVTFGQLWERTGRLGSFMVDRRLAKGDVVVVALPRSIDLFVASFAVFRAGGVALALDLNTPTPRNRRFVELAAARWSIVHGADVPECVDGTTAIDVNDAALPGVVPGELGVCGDDDALLIFTSGSSGLPKGVCFSHRALVERSGAELAASGFRREDLYLFRASPAFIAFPVALAILAGGVRLELATEEDGHDPSRLLDLIGRAQVTVSGFPPRLLESLLDQPDAATKLASLRSIRSAGEPLPKDLAERCRSILPRCRLSDGYGTTETGGVVTLAEVSEGARTKGEQAGAPLPNVRLRLVDEAGKSSTEGEVWVAAPTLASGYLGGEGNDDRRFVEEDESSGLKAKWFRTGDLGRLTPDGRLLVLGRLDLQLNVDGVRIDPVEIEEAFRLHESVEDAAVWSHRDSTGRSRLVAYILDRGTPVSGAMLRSFLGQSLPPNLIPTRFIRLQALPMTPSGKVDRKALPAPEQIESAPRTPRNEVESNLLRLFREVLEVPEMGVGDDFFEWGGDSLSAFDLMERVFETTGVRLSGAVLLRAPTVEELAREVAGGPEGQVSSVWLRRAGDLPPLVCLPGLAADPMWMFPLMAALDPAQPLLGLSFVGLKPPITIPEAVSRGVEELRASQPLGPYFLLGHSLGGVLAFEMARELKSSGEAVAFVGLLDTYVPGGEARLVDEGTRPRPRLRERGKRELQGLKTGLRRILSSLGILKPGRGGSSPRGFREAVQKHRIAPCDLSVTLFRANERSRHTDLAADWAPLAGGGVTVVDIPGQHLTVLTGGRANPLSARIAEAVESARERSLLSLSRSPA